MQVCNNCKIKITSKTDRCPLCHKKIKTSKNKEAFPKFESKINRYNEAKKIISTVSIIVIVTSVLLNIFVIRENYWSVALSACVLYFWGLGLLTFNRKVHLGLKLMSHAITIPLVLIVMNMFATSTKVINNITWALSYTTPFIILCFIFVINFIMIQRRQILKDFLLYQLALCIMGFIPLIILSFGVAKPLYPSIITAICSYTTIIYLTAISWKRIKEEIKKKFHL